MRAALERDPACLRGGLHGSGHVDVNSSPHGNPHANGCPYGHSGRDFDRDAHSHPHGHADRYTVTCAYTFTYGSGGDDTSTNAYSDPYA